jgi:hypothetical protein
MKILKLKIIFTFLENKIFFFFFNKTRQLYSQNN